MPEYLWDHPNIISMIGGGVLNLAWFMFRKRTGARFNASDQTSSLPIRDSRIPWKTMAAVGLGILAVYGLTLESYSSYDGYSYAVATRSAAMYHPNHYLPHLFARWFYLIYLHLMRQNDSLQATKILNACFGAINGILVFIICRRWSHDRLIAVETAFLFAFSFGIWKFAVSGEVYTIMITLWLLTVLVMDELGAEDTPVHWTPVLMLALVANLSVLSHNISGLLAIPIVLALLDRILTLFKVILAGCILFVLLQGGVAWNHGLKTVGEWWHYQMYYSASGYIRQHALYGPITIRTLWYALHDGLFMILTGWETQWNVMSNGLRLIVVMLSCSLWGGIFMLGRLVLLYRKSWIQAWRKTPVTPRFIASSALLWILFNSSWTTGYTESLHWIVPFSTLWLGWLLSHVPRSSEVQTGYIALIVSAAFLSLGINSKEGKIYAAHQDAYVYSDIEALSAPSKAANAPSMPRETNPISPLAIFSRALH